MDVLVIPAIDPTIDLKSEQKADPTLSKMRHLHASKTMSERGNFKSAIIDVSGLLYRQVYNLDGTTAL